MLQLRVSDCGGAVGGEIWVGVADRGYREQVVGVETGAVTPALPPAMYWNLRRNEGKKSHLGFE